jgi:hypothetical protein
MPALHCGNVMVCSQPRVEGTPGPFLACDGQDIFKRLAEHERIGKQRYWHLLDPKSFPRNPHSPPVHRSGDRAQIRLRPSR